MSAIQRSRKGNRKRKPSGNRERQCTLSPQGPLRTLGLSSEDREMVFLFINHARPGARFWLDPGSVYSATVKLGLLADLFGKAFGEVPKFAVSFSLAACFT